MSDTNEAASAAYLAIVFRRSEGTPATKLYYTVRAHDLVSAEAAVKQYITDQNELADYKMTSITDIELDKADQPIGVVREIKANLIGQAA